MEPTPSGSLADGPQGLRLEMYLLAAALDTAPQPHYFLPNHERNQQPRQHLLSFDSFSFSNTFSKWNIFTFQMKGFAYIYIVLHHISLPPNVSYLVISSRHIEREDFFFEEIFSYQKLKPSPRTGHALPHSTLKIT